MNYPPSLGWYIDFTQTAGERIVSPALVQNNKVIFETIIPSSDPCIPGGGGWLMEVSLLSGGTMPTPVFDTNGDGQINSQDALVAGVMSTVGMPTGVTWLNPQSPSGSPQKLMPGSNVNVQSVQNVGANNNQSSTQSVVRRLFWQQIQ